jgi:hypothetical protein
MKIKSARGAVRLAADAVIGTTHVVEGVHRRVADLMPTFGRTDEKPARGITGFVYRAVRSGALLTGTVLDGSLAGIERLMAQVPPGADAGEDNATRLALQAALNGVVGDHLERTSNPLALSMQLRPGASRGPRLLVLVHGLCMNDLQWHREGHDHGAMLEAQAGWSPAYARYNTGRHVSTNGAQLARQIEQLVEQWPVPVESIAIVGHSMGGLVARSAVHHAQANELRWRGHLHHLVHLGTPHHGALLERGGNWVQTVLEVSPYAASLARLAALRSDGITDLRFGNVVDADWQAGRHAHGDTRTPTPLPAGVRCYAVAGSLAAQAPASAIGDGLVTVASALGRHQRPSRQLRFPAANVLEVPGAGHMDLLNDARVARRLRKWLDDRPQAPT